MSIVAIVGSGPQSHLPNLNKYVDEVDHWIGADRGALKLLEEGIPVEYAVGDFDSVTGEERELIFEQSLHCEPYNPDKNETDLEIALQRAFALRPQKIYLFGVTGGRLDHALINIQLLYPVINKGVRGIIIDRWNQLELLDAGTYTAENKVDYPYTSFVPLSEHVKKLTLKDFKYPLLDFDIAWGSTRCISNELIAEKGTISFAEGKLLFIQSRDVAVQKNKLHI